MLYSIQKEIPDASADLLGGKAFGLYRLRKAGVPVPPAFVITTDECREYMVDQNAVMKRVWEVYVPQILSDLKAIYGYVPLVSVRSGAKVSMPGMMDTILNVGLDKETKDFWVKKLGVECVTDSSARLVEMFGNVVLGIERKLFEGKSFEQRADLYKLHANGEAFPDGARQLVASIEAVFKSWNSARAKEYRRIHRISHDLGTAVIVQAMVFGNLNDKSGTGVLFSRNPSDGTNTIVGEFLVNAQGEDVVAGIRTPDPLSKLAEWNAGVSHELNQIVVKLEEEYRDMVDVEFTVEDGKLYILQVRSGKRTARAAVKIAVDMELEGMIDVNEALDRVTLKQFLSASRPSIQAGWLAKHGPHGKGLPASNGVVTGVAVFSSEAAVNCKVPCILVAEETTPDDIAGMNAAVGILTSTGGSTCHAAVVAGGMDKVCVVGCTDLKRINEGTWVLSSVDQVVKKPIKEGTPITLDGNTGSIWVNVEVPVEGGADSEDISRFLSMLYRRHDLYRTCTTAKEIAQAEKVLVATYMLDRELDQSDAPAKLKAMFDAVGDKDAVIDLRTYQDLVREADAPIEYMWGALFSSESLKQFKVNALANESLKNAKVLRAGLTEEQCEHLENMGYTLIDSVSTLEQLLAAKGLVIPDFEALIKASSEQTVLRIVELKRKAGEEVRSFNIETEIEPDDLNRKALYALSGIQAAQSLLRAE